MEKSIYIYSLSSVRDFFPKFFCFEAVENSLRITLFPLILNSVFTYLKKNALKTCLAISSYLMSAKLACKEP